MATPSKAGFTACKAKVREFDTVFEVCSEDGIRIATTSWHDNSSWFPTKCQSRANVGLIAEAFTVAHDTGLTPRQLADAYTTLRAGSKTAVEAWNTERAELAERYKELEETAKSLLMSEQVRDWDTPEAIALRAAIAKAEAGQ